MNYAISYVSTADISLSKEEIDEVLKHTENSNNRQKITGLLLYSDGNFFQVIEGEKAVILKLFDIIIKDVRHHSIIKIFAKEIQNEAFNNYKGDFASNHSQYYGDNLKRYLKNIQSLDEGSQKVVKTMLNIFMK